MPVLVKYSGDWADEFTCQDFCTFENQEAVDVWLKGIEDQIKDGETEFGFGTNEYHLFEKIGDLTRDLTIIHISDEEHDVLYKLFGYYKKTPGEFNNCSFGTSGVF
jgi:hypothetical protein